MTSAKTREMELERLSRLYAALSHVNQAIVLATDRDQLFKRVCSALVDDGGFEVAWIGWTDEATQRLVPVAVCGDADDYLSRIDIYTDDRPEGRGPAGTAVREQRPYVSNDLLNDEATLPWRTHLREHTFRAAAVFPIRRGGKACGALSVYASEVDFFQDKEVKLLEEAAGDISFGLDNLDREADRSTSVERLRQERDFSDAMLNSLPGVLYLYDERGQFLRWNRNFEVATGRTGAEIATMHPLDFFAGPDKDLVAQRIRQVFETGRSEVEAGLRSKDGSSTPYFLTGVVTRFAERTCLVGVGIDVSERVRAEEARRHAEGRYRTLFEKAPAGILISDSQSTYLDANPSMCRMLGYTRAELIGLHAADIVAAEEAPHIGSAINEIHEGGSHRREWQFRRKDGTLVPVEVLATRLPDGNLLGMVRDISERRQGQRALLEMNQSLEHKVAVRTEQLLSAVTRAENADQLKSAFLATMSHELRTPLNSILGFTGVLLQGLAGPLNPEQSKQLGMVRGSARHLLDLINDVLDISKIEAGQLEVRSEPVDLPAAIARAAASVRPLFEKKGLELHCVVDPGISGITADRRRVEQILLNLLSNAIKFTEHGQVTLTARRIEAERLIEVRVHDTGIGIRPEHLRELFQPFRQVDSGLGRSHEGTGLGLAICRRLASLMGGDVTVTSEWGSGSEFVVRLPEGGSAGS